MTRRQGLFTEVEAHIHCRSSTTDGLRDRQSRPGRRHPKCHLPARGHRFPFQACFVHGRRNCWWTSRSSQASRFTPAEAAFEALAALPANTACNLTLSDLGSGPIKHLAEMPIA